MKKISIVFLFLILVSFGLILTSDKAEAIGECSSYGFMATYDYSSDSCKCSYGYVWGEDIFGDPQCVSGSSVCYDKYGYGSRYDSLSNSCECSYGYVFGKDLIGRTQCITETDACQNQLGLHSRSTYGGKCECSYGYIIQGGQCVNGDTYCRSEHGLYSDYDDLSNSCECDYGYTLDDYGQCVEKQNNVYFKVLDLNTDDKTAIIKSEYDSSRYLITYGTGCYSFSFNRYLNKRIVVNLGTDYYVDRYDRIVLQDHDEVCDIRSVEKTYYDSFEEMYPEEEDDIYSQEYIDYLVSNYTESSNSSGNTQNTEVQKQQIVTPPKEKFTYSEIPLDNLLLRATNSDANIRVCPSSDSFDCSVIKTLQSGTKITLVSSYGDWFKISSIEEQEVIYEAWIFSSLVQEIEEGDNQPTQEDTTDDVVKEKKKNIISRFFGWLFGS